MNERMDVYLSDDSITVVEAMQKIDENGEGVLFILDDKKRLIGVVTDGDIRRWIIDTGDLSARAYKFMNTTPKYLCYEDKGKAYGYMQTHSINVLPILDKDLKVAEIIFNSIKKVNVIRKKRYIMDHISVVIMAGGKGTRLYPYTKILPKPLIPVEEVPIIERIINKFCEYGISDYYVTVNYKKGMIKSYFADINPSYNINYIEEEEPLGTAGSLRLIDKKFQTPIIVTNCDILIEADYGDILRYHNESHNVMTIVAALKNTIVPYGVLHTKEHGVLTSIEEKPQMSYFVNTGMYILNPELLREIPKDTVFHMTDLVNVLMDKNKQIGMYPVSEDSFLDMGEFEEMRRMEEKLGQR